MKDQMERLIAQMVDAGMFFPDAVSEFEKRYIRKVLDDSQGNQSRAAKALGIHRNTLGRKLDEYKLEKDGASRRKLRSSKAAKK
ncbi:MAG: response regulator receiver protein [Acidobacteria bacterium]|nr:response regulator receiver protein [Acidobacteriota bacterium]